MGIDGCPIGWLCLQLELSDGRISAVVCRSASEIAKEFSSAQIIAVDIPIGLPEKGSRECDHLSRVLLKRRAGSVFPAPLRECLAAKTWEDACAIRYRVEGKKFSKQSAALIPKICEIDQFLSKHEELRAIVREVHPELSFRGWNNNEPMRYSKRTRFGKDERRLLISHFFGEDSFQTVRDLFKYRDVRSDDILDAFAALWTANRIYRGEEVSIPDVISYDSVGLPMQISY